MVKQTQGFLYLIAVVVFLTGCEKLFPKKPSKVVAQVQTAISEVKGTVIARVNNQPLTLEELNEEVESYNKYVPADKPEEKIESRDKKINYLKNEMIRRALLAQSALDKGLDRKEELQKTLNSFKQNLLVAELIRAETENIEVTSAEIEDYYNQAKEQLKEPEERRIREIVVATENDARDVLIELLKGGDFAILAQMKSTAASAKNGGDLGYIRKGLKSPQFDEAAFSFTLEAGKTSNYFKGPEGYYILKLEARREGKVKSLSELWDDIKNGLKFLKQQKKVEDLIGKLSRDAKIEIREGEIK
jgi:peptidyl-prolyl cis-trans isomerase C